MRVLAALAFLLGFASGSVSGAAEIPPSELVKLRDAFVVALAAKDVNALAALTRFPVENHVYGGPEKISRGAFAKYLGTFGAWEMAGCLKKAKLDRDTRDTKPLPTWSISCPDGNNLFHFSRDGNRWVFSAFENIGE